MSIDTTSPRDPLDIDLGQLGVELAARAGLAEPPALESRRDPDDPTQTQIRCSDPAITQKLLDQVVDAHVPAPPPPTDAERIASLTARLAEAQETTDFLLDTLIDLEVI